MKTYPNSPEVFQLLSQFEYQIKRDFKAAKVAEDQVRLLQRQTRQAPDLPMTLALHVFPNIAPYLQIDSPDEEDTAPSVDGGTADTEPLEPALQDLIGSSRLGRVSIPIAWLTLATCGGVVAYFFFIRSFKDGFIARHEQAITLVDHIFQAHSQLSILAVWMTAWPHFRANPPTPDIMNIIAPNLYTKHHQISMFELTTDDIHRFLGFIGNSAEEAAAASDAVAPDPTAEKELLALWYTGDVYNGEPLLGVFNRLRDYALKLTEHLDYVGYYASADFWEFQLLLMAANTSLMRASDIAMNYAIGRLEDLFASLDEFMVLLIGATLLFIAVPFTLALFRLFLQQEGIAISFTHFPSAEIRALITRLGLTASKVDDVSRIALLPVASRTRGMDYSRFWFAMLASFLLFMGITLGTHFATLSFIVTAEQSARSVASVIPPWVDLWACLIGTLRAYSADLGWSDVFPRNTTLAQAAVVLDSARVRFTESLWEPPPNAVFYVRYADRIPRFSHFLKVQPPPLTSLFESMVAADFPCAIDVIVLALQALITTAVDTPVNGTDERLLAPWYYLSVYAVDHVVFAFCDMVHSGALEEVRAYDGQANLFLGLGIAFQVLVCCVLIASLVDRHLRIRAALRLYQYIAPEVVAQNAAAMALIERGDDTDEPARENFADADIILARMGLGVLLLDGELCVIGANPAARSVLGIDPRGLTVAALANGSAWLSLEQTIRDVLAGKRTPQVTQLVELPEGTILLANAVGLLVHRAARDGEAAGIDRVALVLTDWTDVVKRQRDIDAEQKRLSAMLQKVIPGKLCEDLEGGSNSLAAVSQSVTIGEIRVRPERMDDIGILAFFAKVFGEFELLMAGFDMLSTARICFDRFVYAGGLLAKNRKTARHAEEAVRFALLVLAKVPEIAKRAGREFEIRIGVHTGGPIATGVMSLKKPAFQIIGPVLGLAAQLADEGLAGEVYLSRATYELIFASGFRIRERGEMTVRGGGTTMTYLVEPRVYR